MYALANNVVGTLKYDITGAAASLVMAPIAGAAFNLLPAPTDATTALTYGEPYGILTLIDRLDSSAAKIEHVLYTARAVEAGGAYTYSGLVRGQEGTAAQAWTAGGYIVQQATKGVLADETRLAVLRGEHTLVHARSGAMAWDGAGFQFTTFRALGTGRGKHFSTAGYFDITLPANGTTVKGWGGAADQTVAAGAIPIPENQALWYEPNIGGGSASIAANFRLTAVTGDFTVPPHWILLATHQAVGAAGEKVLRIADGTTLTPGTCSGGSAVLDIIGGDFSKNPWQDGTSFTAPATGAYTADMFSVEYSTSAVVDCLQTVDGPTPAEAGVYSKHCLHLDVTTADAAIAAGDYYALRYFMQGVDAAQYGFGQAGVRYIHIPFWVKSTKTGVFCFSVANSANNRSYVAEYTVYTSDAEEFKVITIPVDTAGTWLIDNGVGLRLRWALAAGLNLQWSSTWVGGNYFATVNQVNALDSIANNFKISLVGRPNLRTQAEESARCYEYYWRDQATAANYIFGEGRADTTTNAFPIVTFPVKMRANPTLGHSGNAAHYETYFGGTAACLAVPTISGVNRYRALVNFTVGAGLTAGQVGWGRAASTSGYLAFNARMT